MSTPHPPSKGETKTESVSAASLPAQAEARAKEREKLLTKAKGKAKEDKSEDKKGGANEARAAFFRRALETAHGLGVVDCQDCKIKTN